MAKRCNIGGQALIEGVMMRGVRATAIAVRRPDGGIEIKCEPTPEIYNKKIFKYPIIRGIGALISSMSIGINALAYSAEVAGFEEEEDSKFDKWVKDKFGEHSNKILTGISIAISLGLAILMFTILPTFISAFLKNVIKSSIMLSFIEGIIKLTLFLGYIYAISKMKDIKRVFEYHGAEHMSIHCLEAGLELTPDNVKKFSPIHERCGTSFLVYFMLLSILLYSFISWSSIAYRVVLKILFLPVIAGLGYELLKFNAGVSSKFMEAISKPGLWLQKITTQPPHTDQIEVAIAALKAVLNFEKDAKGDESCKH